MRKVQAWKKYGFELYFYVCICVCMKIKFRFFAIKIRRHLNVLHSTKWDLICYWTLPSDQHGTLYIKALRYYVAWSAQTTELCIPFHITLPGTHAQSHTASFSTFSVLYALSPFSLSSRWEIPESFSTLPFLVLPTCNQSLCPVSSNSESPLTSVSSFPSHCHPLISHSPSLWLEVGNLIGLSVCCSLAILKHPTSRGQSSCPLRGPRPKSPWMNYRPCPNCPLPGCLHSHKTFCHVIYKIMLFPTHWKCSPLLLLLLVSVCNFVTYTTCSHVIFSETYPTSHPTRISSSSMSSGTPVFPRARISSRFFIYARVLNLLSLWALF